MAPPVTPSPHRFLAGGRRAPSPTKDGQDIPAPRPQHRPIPEVRSVQSHGTSSQFAPTPRFGRTNPMSQWPLSPPKPVLAQALRASFRPTDAVEDVPEQHEDDEMLDNEQAYALPTTEKCDQPTPWTNDLTLSPKRRRLEPAESFRSSEGPVFKHPQTSTSYFAKTVPRVLHPQTQESISTDNSEYAAPRPAFLPSSVAPSEQSEPLPDAFSPHKRGQKFVPGGMAATMQQWVLEAGQSAIQSRKGLGYLQGENSVLRAKIESSRGDGPHIAIARGSNGEPVNLILTGASQNGRTRDRELLTGRVVGVRAPTWTVDIAGEPYMVAFDWKVLQ